MPIRIPENLPATGILQRENIFVISEERALHQDIRPLKLAVLNLMPTKVETETQMLRLIGNSPLQVEVVLLTTESHTAKNTSAEHLLEFYRPTREVMDDCYDGLIVTGAPVELMEFEEVDYWRELREVFDWASKTFIRCYPYAGVPRRRCTTTTEYRRSRWTRSSRESTNIGFWKKPTNSPGDLTIGSSFPTPGTPR